MKSLRQLAEEGNLPIHQNIDSVTLDWIKKNKPNNLINVDCSKVIESVNIDEISRLTPISSWFTSVNKINSLHGKRHLMRVAIYTMYLTSNMKSIVKRNSVTLAALLHDIRRETDKGDEGHAKRGVSWYLDNKDEIYASLNINEIDDNIVIELIEQHEKMSDKDSNLLNILKTADALDRYVQPKKKWWINEDYLNLKPSVELKSFAFDLVVKSEERYLNGSSSRQSILDTLKEMKN